MIEKKRGIRLKPVNEGQEGYQALIDFFAAAGIPAAASPPATPTKLVSAVPQGIEERQHARRKLARLLRLELEETLRLLEQALPED